MTETAKEVAHRITDLISSEAFKPSEESPKPASRVVAGAALGGLTGAALPLLQKLWNPKARDLAEERIAEELLRWQELLNRKQRWRRLAHSVGGAVVGACATFVLKKIFP